MSRVIPFSLLIPLLLAACIAQAASGAPQGVIADKDLATQTGRVHQRLRRSNDEVTQLRHTVAEQESKSRAADRRLREQDRELEELRRQLQSVQRAQGERQDAR